MKLVACLVTVLVTSCAMVLPEALGARDQETLRPRDHGAAASSCAPLYEQKSNIKHHYIVHLHGHVPQQHSNDHLVAIHRAQLENSHQLPQIPQKLHGVTGANDARTVYTGYFSESVIQKIRQHPFVRFVEQDGYVKIAADEEAQAAQEAQAAHNWGLARISSKKLVTRPDLAPFRNVASGGKGVTLYILDTGVRASHQEFTGRIDNSTTFIGTPETRNSLSNGHGTHCAGIAAGKTFGSAPNVNIVSMKVLDHELHGSISGIRFSMDNVISRHMRQRANSEYKGSVVSASFTGDYSRTINEAVKEAIAAGVHVVVSAGNSASDACKYSPASSDRAITVGSVNATDDVTHFSNTGSCVDIYAPGDRILSSWIYNDTSTEYFSGTSQAAPFVAGVVASILSHTPSAGSGYAGSITPLQMKQKLIDNASEGKKGVKIVYNGAGDPDFLQKFYG